MGSSWGLRGITITCVRCETIKYLTKSSIVCPLSLNRLQRPGCILCIGDTQPVRLLSMAILLHILIRISLDVIWRVGINLKTRCNIHRCIIDLDTKWYNGGEKWNWALDEQCITFNQKAKHYFNYCSKWSKLKAILCPDSIPFAARLGFTYRNM